MHFMAYIVIGVYIGFFLGIITIGLFRKDVEEWESEKDDIPKP
tara:strand:- start:155 stop:283 length:129 start_codon:yes stop_codon:yes gene_type:complete